MAHRSYLSVLADQLGKPVQVVEINPETWAPNPGAPPPDTPLDSMRHIARDSLTTLLHRQGSQEVGNQCIIDPNGVARRVLIDPGPINQGADPAE